MIAVVNDQPIMLRELETELILIAIINNPLIILPERENELNIQEIKNPPNTVRRAVLETLIEQETNVAEGGRYRNNALELGEKR